MELIAARIGPTQKRKQAVEARWKNTESIKPLHLKNERLW